MKIIGVVGWKNAGKTTLIEKLLPDLSAEEYADIMGATAQRFLDAFTKAAQDLALGRSRIDAEREAEELVRAKQVGCQRQL